MIENLPPFIGLCFALIAISTIAFYLYAVWGDRPARVATHAGVLVLILAVHSYLALSGFYLVASIPPRFFLTLFPSTAILIILWYWPGRNRVSTETLRVLTLLSVIRVPVEVILLWLYREGHVPQLMTFDGRNLDILSGLTAPVVALLGFRGGKINRPILIAWNLVALGLLLNIVAHAILSLETPFQKFAFAQPNRALLYFPFIWLPAVIVPIVFVSHIASLWQLLFISRPETGTFNKRKGETLMKQAICLMIIFGIAVTSNVIGQISSNGTLVLDQSVIASGGNVSVGQGFSVNGTAGQSIAGVWSTAAASQHHSGFWNGEPLGPTAAHVDLGGRVTTSDGRPIRNARISLTESGGATHSAITNPFGSYTFSGIVAGQSVLISVTAKGFTFEEPTIVFNVSDSFDQLNFSAL